MQFTSRSAGSGSVTRRPPSSAVRAAARSGVRFHTITSRAPAPRSAHTAARAVPPAPSTSAVLSATGSPIAASRPGASVLSARMAPSANVSVLAAPISSTRRSAASLCGIVTFAPTKPAGPRALTVSANSSGGMGNRW